MNKQLHVVCIKVVFDVVMRSNRVIGSPTYFLTLSKNCELSLFGAYMLMILNKKPESCRSTNRRLPTLSFVTFLIEYSKLYLIIIPRYSSGVSFRPMNNALVSWEYSK